MKRGFASDNNSGVSPEVLEKFAEINKGHVVGYGDDIYTKKAINLLKGQFGESAIPFLVFTGTAANVLSIAAATKSYHSVICASTAHINIDECGAPEKFSGCKLLSVNTPNGKLHPVIIAPLLAGKGFEHHVQPRLVSISQPTEMGTVYTVEEIKQLSAFAHENKLLLHMDGARLANAAVSLKLPFRAFTADAGVDILSFGGTKNGLMAAESIIFFNPALAENFKYIRKQGMQLASKMRFVAAQFIAYLENNLWERNAINANKLARYLCRQVKGINNLTVTQPVQANGVFAIVPKEIIEKLRKEFFFYTWNEEAGEVRWMTSFDTQKNDIDEFVSILKQLL
ncbi:MAG: low specificity L-threonine aldolase [Bacteroidales bacterium]|nr:low specificity L-threonine aldolase [Bacteroidales bacterium]